LDRNNKSSIRLLNRSAELELKLLDKALDPAKDRRYGGSKRFIRPSLKCAGRSATHMASGARLPVVKACNPKLLACPRH
jgi:hypothetical protein